MATCNEGPVIKEVVFNGDDLGSIGERMAAGPVPVLEEGHGLV